MHHSRITFKNYNFNKSLKKLFCKGKIKLLKQNNETLYCILKLHKKRNIKISEMLLTEIRFKFSTTPSLVQFQKREYNKH